MNITTARKTQENKWISKKRITFREKGRAHPIIKNEITNLIHGWLLMQIWSYFEFWDNYLQITSPTKFVKIFHNIQVTATDCPIPRRTTETQWQPKIWIFRDPKQLRQKYMIVKFFLITWRSRIDTTSFLSYQILHQSKIATSHRARKQGLIMVPQAYPGFFQQRQEKPNDVFVTVLCRMTSRV